MEHILYAAINALILFFSCTNTLASKLSWYKNIAIITYLFIATLLFSSYGQVAGFFVIGLLFTLIYIFSGKSVISLVCAILGYLGNVTLNHLVLFLVEKMFNFGIVTLQEKYSIQFSLLYMCLVFVGSKGLGRVLKHNFHIEHLKLSKKVLRLLTASLSLCACIYISNFTLAEISGYSPQVVQTNGLLFSLYFIVNILILLALFRVVQIEKEREYKLQQFDAMQLYTKEMEKFHKEFRAAKHDYHNVLLVIDGYLKEEDFVGLKELFARKSIGGNLKEADDNFDFLSLQAIKSSDVKGILYNKILYASAKGVETEFLISEKIIFKNIDEFDLSRILGIFLDNAIEAALETDTPSIHISLSGVDTVSIKIGNCCVSEEIELSRLSEFDFSTKGKGRGVGLYEVSKILENYPEVYHEIFFEHQYFMQILDNL